MKYEQLINDAYASLNFFPRDNQVETINNILISILDERYNDIILCAPTGTGKSLIGAVTAECIGKIQKSDLSSIILVHNNALAKQYYKTFSGNHNFAQLKGASQYPCDALNSVSKNSDDFYTAEECMFGVLQNNTIDDVMANAVQKCYKCEYLDVKNKRNTVKHLITNYSYYFVDRMYADVLSKRCVTVWDEAHTINDIFTEHNAIYISEKHFNKITEEITNHLKLGKTDVYNTIKRITTDLKDGLLNEKTYMAYMLPLYNAYKLIAEQCKSEMEMNIKNINKYTQFSRLHKKYFGLGCKIDDLLKYGYEHVPQLIKENGENEFSIKPIFVGDMFEKTLRFSDFNIFMSATISDHFLIKTLNLNKNKTKFIHVEPTFPKENKKIVFYKPQSLNYNSMKDETVLSKIDKTVLEIVKFHSSDKGIVLCPSFVVSERLSKFLRKNNVKVFEHIRGEKLEKILEMFKNYDSPSILLSPSMFEGIDLPDDHSRFQIFVKAPFASLGDKRIKYIMENYPEIYELMTIKRLVQGSGRSVRSKEDYAITYMIDSNISRLWRSKNNIWQKEFLTMQKSFLNNDE
jgi:Rad3-related DNA helicase